MNVNGKTVRIVLRRPASLELGANGMALEPPLFALLDQDGAELATGPSSKTLAKRAFAAGAFEVRHAYDLRHET